MLHLTVADWITIVSGLVAIELAIGHGTIQLTNAIPDRYVPVVQAWCNILAGVGSILVTILSRSVAAIIVVIIFLSFALPASAQTSTSTTLTPQSVAQKIQQLAPPDLAYSILLAKAVGTPQGNVRAQCYQAIQSAIPVAPAGSTAPPAPHLVTNVEELAEVIDALQPNSPLFVNCGGAAQLISQNVLVFVNAVVTGFLGATKALPLLAPVIP